MEVDEDKSTTLSPTKSPKHSKAISSAKPLDSIKTEEKAKELKEDEKEGDEKEGEEKVVKERKEPEPTIEILQNPARIITQQLNVISLVEGSESPETLKDVSIGGIVMLQNSGENDQLLAEPVAEFVPKPEDKEPKPPEPFEFNED